MPRRAARSRPRQSGRRCSCVVELRQDAEKRQVRHDAAGKNLGVLDLAGHHGVASRRRPSAGRCTCRAGRAKSSGSRRRGARAASLSSGKVSSFAATIVTSCPCARAASRTRNGKRPLPAMSPSFIRRRPAPRRAGSAPQDDAALRGADEVDEVPHFRRRERRVLLDLRERAAWY